MACRASHSSSTLSLGILVPIAIGLGITIPSRRHRADPPTCQSRPTSSTRSEEHTSELHSRQYLVWRLLLEKKRKKQKLPPSLVVNCSRHSTASRVQPY